jgi:hypothetical protein
MAGSNLEEQIFLHRQSQGDASYIARQIHGNFNLFNEATGKPSKEFSDFLKANPEKTILILDGTKQPNGIRRVFFVDQQRDEVTLISYNHVIVAHCWAGLFKWQFKVNTKEKSLFLLDDEDEWHKISEEEYERIFD